MGACRTIYILRHNNSQVRMDTWHYGIVYYNMQCTYAYSICTLCMCTLEVSPHWWRQMQSPIPTIVHYVSHNGHSSLIHSLNNNSQLFILYSVVVILLGVIDPWHTITRAIYYVHINELRTQHMTARSILILITLFTFLFLFLYVVIPDYMARTNEANTYYCTHISTTNCR